MNLFDLAVSQVLDLRGACAVLAANAVLDEDGVHFRVHVNLLDNVASALSSMGVDWSNIAEFRKDGDEVVRMQPKQGALAELVARVTKLQAVVDKNRGGGDDWSPVTELFHPDMNIDDIRRAVAQLLKVHAIVAHVLPGSTKAGNDLQVVLDQCRESLWEGRPTQFEIDAASKRDSGVEKRTRP